MWEPNVYIDIYIIIRLNYIGLLDCGEGVSQEKINQLVKDLNA